MKKLGPRILVSSAEQDRRMSICKGCPEFYEQELSIPKSKPKFIPRCRKCGCWLTGKTWIPGQHCPLSKW